MTIIITTSVKNTNGNAITVIFNVIETYIINDNILASNQNSYYLLHELLSTKHGVTYYDKANIYLIYT